jgi:hypothetical protein
MFYVAVFENEEASYPLQVVTKADIALITTLSEEGYKDQVIFIKIADNLKKPLAKEIVKFTKDWGLLFGNTESIAPYVMALLDVLKVY